MRVVAIVQARMGSQRLPGKVLAELAGRSMLARVVGRLLDARSLDEIVIATSTLDGDDPVAREAARLGVAVHRGPELDVLARYHQAARAAKADAIVRVTADCPLIDPGVVDDIVAALAPAVDYASNTHVRTYPRGLDAEALHRDTLERIARLATSAAAREHVTAYVLEEPALFRIAQVRAAHDDSDLRWTVDTPEDLAFARAVYKLFGDGTLPPLGELIALVRARPDLVALNAHVAQKATHV